MLFFFTLKEMACFLFAVLCGSHVAVASVQYVRTSISSPATVPLPPTVPMKRTRRTDLTEPKKKERVEQQRLRPTQIRQGREGRGGACCVLDDFQCPKSAGGRIAHTCRHSRQVYNIHTTYYYISSEFRSLHIPLPSPSPICDASNAPPLSGMPAWLRITYRTRQMPPPPPLPSLEQKQERTGGGKQASPSRLRFFTDSPKFRSPTPPPSQPPTVACKMEAQSEYVHIACTFFARSAPICMLSPAQLLTKISASELSQQLIKSTLLVGFVLVMRAEGDALLSEGGGGGKVISLPRTKHLPQPSSQGRGGGRRGRQAKREKERKLF